MIMKKVLAALQMTNDAVINFLKKYWLWLSLAVVFALAIVARIPLYSKTTGDYNSFLVNWYNDCYTNSKEFLAKGDVDYTPTYLYSFVVMTWFKIKPFTNSFLYTLKTISVVFDFGTAFLIFYMVKFIFKKNDVLTLISTTLALFLPQILLNSAFWGQCDSIYTFFIVLSLFFIFIKKEMLSAISFGISFALKLQSVFFLPVLVLLWLNKKYKFWYLLLIPVTYIVLMIPAMICGRSFMSCLTVYFTQAEEYTYLSMAAPNIYSFMYKTLTTNDSVASHLVPAATVFGLVLILVVCVIIFATQKDYSFENIIKISFFITLFAPYVLPKMHDRYFYIAEVLAILYIVINPKKWYISLLAVGGTFQGYNLYLFNTYYLGDRDFNMIIGATLIMAALILLGYDLFKKKNEPLLEASQEN